MTIGERIKNRRIELGMTQAELAAKLGYTSRTSICSIEKGKEDLTTNRVNRIAEALETTPANLMGWNVPEEKDISVSMETKDLSHLTRIGAYAEHMYPDNANIKDIRNRIAQIETEPTEATKALLLYQKYQQAPDFVQAAIRKLLGDPESES